MRAFSSDGRNLPDQVKGSSRSIRNSSASFSSNSLSLGAAVTELVERRELLVHANWVLGAEGSHRGAQRDPAGDTRRCCQHCAGARDRVLLEMVLAETIEAQTELIGPT